MHETEPDVTTAAITERHPFVAKPTAAIDNVFRKATPGDRIEVKYVRNGSVTTATGTVTDVDREFGDIRFDTANGECYLHINTDTGDYQFADPYPESPEEGRRITRVKTTRRDN